MKRILVLFLGLTVAVAMVAGDGNSGETPKAQLKVKRTALKGTKAPGPFVDLGNWCVDKKLMYDARWCFQRAWDLEKGHEGARKGMNKVGYDLDGKRFRPIKSIYDKRRKRIKGSDVDGRYELAIYIKGFGLEKEALKELKRCVRIDPEHPKARIALGFTRMYGKWLTAKQVEQEKKIDLIWKTGLDGKKPASELLVELKDAGFKGKVKEVTRVIKLLESPRGTHRDVKLIDKAYDKGEYTYGVPSSYKAWRKNPLIVFLHGGGPGVGDGDDYFPQIWPHSGPKGYLTICPTVLQKVSLAWNNSTHESYLRKIVEEFKTKYNVDPQRTYLMGHSMGGFGCFYHGTRMTDLFAAISPWSGGPGRSQMSNLKNTPIYIIHGNKDQQVNVSGSRRAAAQLKKLEYEYVYVELDIPGHGVPSAEKQKAVDWLERWKLSPKAGGKRR